MRVIIALFLLLIYPICSMAQNDFDADLSNAIRSYGIGFEANDSLLVPQMSFADGANEYISPGNPIRSIPIYSSSQSIIGSLHTSQNRSNSNCSRSDLSVCLSPFSLSQFLAGLPDVANVSWTKCSEVIDEINDLNCSNRSRFQIGNVTSGMHMAYLIDKNSSKVLDAVPLMVTQGNIVLQMSHKVLSDEPFIQVKMNTTEQGNSSKFFAAIMLSRSDYNNISLNLSQNKSSNGIDITLYLGDRSIEVPNPAKVSTEFLINMLPLLPQNSAIGLQESTQSGVDLILLTDKPWNKGNYILTCGVYSPSLGLLGIKQSEVEVI
ncbi:MAG: hypothetical protein LUQ59_01275 [Methanothrix sp.]|nr:hypothetical protein [Methanothrix sp.]